jgi:aryl-alcohol dehydrogenase-like predicted oxidoreductase
MRKAMEHRHLGASGFTIPVLSFGAGTFGGKGSLFGAWDNTSVTRLHINICLEAGVTMFDAADAYPACGSKSRRSKCIADATRLHWRLHNVARLRDPGA